MELKVKKITLDSFRGVHHKEVIFDGNTKIKGCNGSGKSTIMSSYLWTLMDVDSKLAKNPDVIPIGENECKPTVEIEFELDGKPLTVCKQQKFKRKEVDGKITSSNTNSYSINGVEKSLKAFTEDLAERGIDMEKILLFCHPDAFTADVSAKGREKIREILFGMIDGVSDVDIAKTINAPELTTLLEEKGYKLEEIDAMAKSSLRKLNEKYGKENELIDSRIAGILQSKSDVNVTDLEKQKSEYESELDKLRDDYKNLKNTDSETEAKIAVLEGKSIEIERSLQGKIDADLASASEKIRNQEHLRNDLEIDMINKKHEMDRLLADKEGIADSLENYRNLYKKVQDEVFDESSLKCPCCGRKYSADKAEKMKQTFEDSKTKRLNDYKSRGETFAKQLEAIQEKYDVAKTNWEEADKEWHKADDKAQNFAEELSIIPRKPNLVENKEYQAVRAEIESLRESLSRNDDSKLQELSNHEDELIQKINQIIGELAIADRNNELDAQIADLRAEKKEAEIQRAKNEKLINQVKIFTQAKNDLLTSKINEKFSMVDWHLWEYQKNGEIKPVCEPYIDGKPMTSAANGSLITLAKISICADLQKHFGQIMPIWCDDYGLFSSNTSSRIDIDSQLIGLVVTEDKELVIENA